jgi:hypothetical protein
MWLNINDIPSNKDVREVKYNASKSTRALFPHRLGVVWLPQNKNRTDAMGRDGTRCDRDGWGYGDGVGEYKTAMFLTEVRRMVGMSFLLASIRCP